MPARHLIAIGQQCHGLPQYVEHFYPHHGSAGQFIGNHHLAPGNVTHLVRDTRRSVSGYACGGTAQSQREACELLSHYAVHQVGFYTEPVFEYGSVDAAEVSTENEIAVVV